MTLLSAAPISPPAVVLEAREVAREVLARGANIVEEVVRSAEPEPEAMCCKGCCY